MLEAMDLSAALPWTVGALLLLSWLFSVLAALIERSGPVRLRHWVEEADGGLRRLYGDPARFEGYRFLVSVGAKGLPLGLAWTAGLGLSRLEAPAPWLTAFGAAFVLVAVFEALNRLLVVRAAETMLERLTPVYRVLLYLLRPVLWATGPILPLPQREDDEDSDGEEEDEASDEEIEAFIAFGTREGILEPDKEDWVWGIVDFGDTLAKSVMTPRIDMRCASVSSSSDELVELFLDSGHSRIPLFEDSIDRIVGILHIRDLVRSLETPEHPPVRTLAKPPFIIPETKRLDELLKEMQAQHEQMAIVVDEYGGTSGVVTVEDLLEEIVGEIIDEHEIETPELEALPDGSYRMDGRVHVDVLEEELGVEVGETPYETVGGMVFSIVGDVPEVGQVVTWEGLRVQVESVEDRRIRSVRVEKLEAPKEIETGGTGDAA